MLILDSIAQRAIIWYKKEISPGKGFNCAHRVLHQGESCSTAVLQIVQGKGLLAGFPDIIKRFISCHQSAKALLSKQRTDLDCGISGCFDVGGAEGCFGGLPGSGGGSSAGRVSNCGCISLIDLPLLFTGKNGKRNTGIFLVVLALSIALGYFSYGNKITGIKLKLVQAGAEDRDRKWGLVANSELPDYQVLLSVDGVGEVSSVTKHNVSAAKWLNLHFPQAFDHRDIKTMTITNRQLFSNKELEVFSGVPMRGEGEHFQYRLTRRWSFF